MIEYHHRVGISKKQNKKTTPELPNQDSLFHSIIDTYLRCATGQTIAS